MNNTTNPSGLMSASPAERSELLKLIHNAFGPAPTQSRSLEQRLASLTEVELKRVMQWANFVKMSQNFGKANQAKSYAQLTHEMYGGFGDQRKSLIADLLQESEAPKGLMQRKLAEYDLTSLALLIALAAYEAGGSYDQ